MQTNSVAEFIKTGAYGYVDDPFSIIVMRKWTFPLCIMKRGRAN